MTPAFRFAILVVMLVVGSSGPGLAQVSCSNPDNLCTGDPCVIPSLDVASPCVVDFGSRTVVVDGTLRMPVDGVLSLTAGSFDVRGTITGSGSFATFAAVTLTASGNVEVDGRIRLTGRDRTGNVKLVAGGDIRVDGYLLTRGLERAGEVRLEAQGNVTTKRRIDTSAVHSGQIWIVAGGNVDLGGVRGTCRVEQCNGAFVVVRADGFVTVRRTVWVSGWESGALDIMGDAGIDVQAPLLARGGGYLQAQSDNGSVHVRKTLVTYGRYSGGGLSAYAFGDVTIDRSIRSKTTGTSGEGESSGVIICSHTGNLVVNGRLVASYIQIDVAAGSALLNADIDTTGITGQILSVRAASIQVSPRATLRTNDQFGDEIVFEATGGDLRMSGTFLARGLDDGLIQGSATGNLVADGRFEVLSNCESPPCGGCIGLSAGGTLDTSGGTFDATPVGTCNAGTDEICS